MNIPIVGKLLDERFFEYRRRSTSLAGMAAAIVTAALFAYHLYIRGHWNWDLCAVLLALVVVKFAAMAWYYATD